MRYLMSGLGVLAALVLMGVSGAMNWMFMVGQGKTPEEGHLFGALSVAVDLFKALLPLFIAWAWSDGRRAFAILASLAFVVFFSASLLSALGFAAGNRGAVTGGRETLNARLEDGRRELAAVESKLAALGAHRPASVIEAELQRLKQDRRFTSSEECGRATAQGSRDFCDGLHGVRRELAVAAEGVRLEGDRQRLRTDLRRLEDAGAGRSADAQASLLSRLLPGVAEDRAQLAVNVFIALLVEFGSAFGLFLATGFGLERRGEGTRPQRVHAEVVNEPVARPGWRARAMPAGNSRAVRPHRLQLASDGTLLVEGG